jgi:hypothetical protein
VAGSARRLVGNLIAAGCFRTSAPKAENGFVAQENCFVDLGGTKHRREKSNQFRRTPDGERDQAGHRKAAVAPM